LHDINKAVTELIESLKTETGDDRFERNEENEEIDNS
jgi:hypothetical protein